MKHLVLQRIGVFQSLDKPFLSTKSENNKELHSYMELHAFAIWFGLVL